MQNKFNIVFDRLKEIKIDENVLCKPFWIKVLRLHNNFNEKDCWELMTKNIDWLLNAKKHHGLNIDILTSSELIDWFTEKELNANNIYISGEVEINDGYAIGLGNVKIDAIGHSQILLFDNASADCYDTTFVFGYDNSQFTVNDCMGSAFGNCMSEAKGVSLIDNYTTNEVSKSSRSLVVNR